MVKSALVRPLRTYSSRVASHFPPLTSLGPPRIRAPYLKSTSDMEASADNRIIKAPGHALWHSLVVSRVGSELGPGFDLSASGSIHQRELKTKHFLRHTRCVFKSHRRRDKSPEFYSASAPSSLYPAVVRSPPECLL